MSINTNIYLSSHAKTKEVFDVILKITGTDFKQSSFDNKDYNPLIECNESNPWHTKPIKNINNKITPDIDYFSFDFYDCIGNKYHTLYFFEGIDDSEYANEKLLNPNHNTIWCCIGKRLVDFFGGRLLYSDSADIDDPNSWYVCNNPKYPAKIRGQSGNDRWFQYHNILNDETMLPYKLKHSRKFYVI